MKILYSGKVISSAVAIGNFDGIHIGHSFLIGECKKAAEKKGIESLVFSFEKAPMNVIKGKNSVKSIMSNEEKAFILEKMGMDALYLSDFAKLRDMSPEEFCERVLIDTLGAKKVFCGFNFTFGKGAAGNAEFLAEYMRKRGIEAEIIPEKKLHGITISSTAIREMLEKGEVEMACEFLGRPYFLRLPIGNDKGEKRLYLPEGRVIPAEGKYLCNITAGENHFDADLQIIKGEKGYYADIGAPLALLGDNIITAEFISKEK